MEFRGHSNEQILPHLLSNVSIVECHPTKHAFTSAIVLRWLTLSFGSRDIAEIEHVVGIVGDEDSPTSELRFNLETCPENGEEEIFSICSSLVTITPNPNGKADA